MIRIRSNLIGLCITAFLLGPGSFADDLQALLLGVCGKTSDECPLSENEKENRWELEEEEKLSEPLVSFVTVQYEKNFECNVTG